MLQRRVVSLPQPKVELPVGVTQEVTMDTHSTAIVSVEQPAVSAALDHVSGTMLLSPAQTRAFQLYRKLAALPNCRRTAEAVLTHPGQENFQEVIRNLYDRLPVLTDDIVSSCKLLQTSANNAECAAVYAGRVKRPRVFSTRSRS